MPDTAATSHQPPEDRFLAWVDAVVDPAGTIPVPDADLADLAGTAAFVQRVAGPGSAPSLSTDRTETIWEEIMHTAPTPATLTPTLTGSTGARPIAPRALPDLPNSGWRTWLPTALLIAAIVAAGIVTAWRIAGPFGIGGNDGGPETARQPGIAAPATPATVSADGCPLTNDMLVFVGDVSDLPKVQGSGPSMAVVEPDGDFVITCGGVDNPEPLMTGIANVMPLQWPGTLLLERDDGSALALNMATGKHVELGDSDVVYGMYSIHQFAPSWLVSPANAPMTDWRITNLVTMDSFTLSDELGGVLEEKRTISIHSGYGASTAVIAFDGVFTSTMGPNVDLDLPPNPEEVTTVEVPDRALVVDSTFQTRRWIDATGSVAVSPDGSTIAYQTAGESGSTIRIEDASTGDLRAELTGSNFVGTPPSDFAFDGDGDALVYLDGNDIWIATWDGSLETTRVDTGGIRPSAVQTVNAPDRVVVERLSDQGGARTSLTGNRAISELDTGTSTITHVDGLVADNNLLPSLALVSRRDYAVTVVTAPESPDQMVMHLVDIATGQTVARSEPIPATAISDTAAATYSGDGAIAVVNLDGTNALYLNATTGTVASLSTESLSTVDGNRDVRWFVAPSNDGLYLYAFGEIASATPTSSSGGNQYFSISLLSSEPSWSRPVDSMPTGAILGSPAADATDEPAVLEAQEFATPAPVGTPAPPVTESAGCDLSADIPVVTDLAAAPEGRTALLLDDGTLLLTCDAATIDVAEGVAGVVPGSTWPGAVLLHMNDGSLRGVNLLTGAEGDLGAFHDAIEQWMPRVRVTRWMIFPTAPEQLDWRIVDLETMDSFLLSDELGGVLPHSTMALLYATTPDAAVISFGGIPILPPGTGSLDLGATPAPGTPIADLPGEWSALVIDGSLDARRWLQVPNPSIKPATISPDGELLAIEQAVGDHRTVRVERLSDGALVADTDIDYGGGDGMALLNGSAGLLHLSPDRLDRVSWDAEGKVAVDTLIAFESPPAVPVLAQSAEPGIAVVGATGPAGESIGYLVDANSGEVTEVPGMLPMPFVYAPYLDGLPPEYVLAAAPGASASGTVVQLIDIATGEPAVSSEPIDVGVADLTMTPAALRGDAGFIFLPDGRIVTLDAGSGEAAIIAPPTGESVDSGYSALSPHGDAVIVWSTSSGRGFIRAVAPDSQWVEVTPSTFITFVAGSGGRLIPGG